ncbi:Putative Permease of the major facilitator superfamily [Penicillium brasilianum]|uniref:Putative Permease of the major facilitator superfamily n=1 Tax=Penicillium brasilianum TaxID=104259 RepID=A0A0F7TF65_PENBI|nr:Putative Permease of the major facilitator superfamily [Penicillium brasilianum]
MAVEEEAIAPHNPLQEEDEAMRAFAGAPGGVQDIDKETNARLLKIIDRNLLPLLCTIYGLNFLDKTTLSYASVMGLQSDIGLTGDQYQWLGSIFYFGYLAVEYPSSRLLQHYPLAKYSSLNIILWGATLACFAAVTDFRGAAVVRFFLGVFEAVVTPGFALFTSQWYTKHEQGSRTGIWFGFNGVAMIVGGVLAYGIAKGTEGRDTAIEPWRILFLVTGCFTVVIGLVFLYYMPDNQWNVRFLKPEDRILAVQRIRQNQQGIGNKHFKMSQFKEALLDPMTWAFAFFACAGNIPNGGITNFFSQIIKNSGYTAAESLLYSAPGGAIQAISLIVSGILSDKYHQRIYVSCVGLAIGLLGAVLLAALPLSNSLGRLIAFYLTQASPTAFVALLSFISTNVAGSTKKTTVAAIYMIGYCVGNILGPQTFRPKDAPRYIPAEITICCCWAACLIDMLVIRYWYRVRNAQKERIRLDPDYQEVPLSEFKDLTDLENPELIYVL